jgi:hypothetical protein
MNKIRLLVQAIVMVGILTGCDSCNDDDMVVPYIIIKGKTVLIHNTTGQDLYASGVMTKLNAAADLINAANDFDTTIFNTVHARGMVIAIENPATTWNSYKTNGDGKTIRFDIKYLSNTGTTAGTIAGYIDAGIATLNIYGNITRALRASPHRVGLSPCGVDLNPYGVDLNPCGVDLNPCGVDYSPRGVDYSPCGVDLSPCGVDLSPYSMDYRPLLRRVA